MSEVKKQKKEEDNWIDHPKRGIVVKRSSLRSTVNIIVTNDPVRCRELEIYAMEHGLVIDKKKDQSQVFVYDDWNQLAKLKRDEGFTREPQKLSMDDMMSASDTLGTFLKRLDNELKNKKTVVIFEGMIEGSKSLNQALNSWCVDDAIFVAKSTVCVFVPSRDLIPESIRHKCNVIEIEPSSVEERRLQINHQSNQYSIGLNEEQVEELVSKTAGLDRKQLEGALIESALIYGTFNADHISQVKGELLSSESIVKVRMHSDGLGFAKVGGYQTLKDYIQNNVVAILKDKERADHFKLKIPQGILVFGIEGTGKTILAEGLGDELGIPFLEVNVQNIFDKFVGESEKRLEQILKLIDAISPCIVYVDEIDALAGNREGGDMDSGATKKTMSVFMRWLAKPRNSLVYATTNRPQDIDPAFMRAGRFDVIIPQLLPDIEARLKILEVHTNIVRKQPHNLTDENYLYLAECTDLFNGAELELLVLDAGKHAFHTDREVVTFEDYQHVLDGVTFDKEKRERRQKAYIDLAKEFVTDSSFLDALSKGFKTSGTRSDIAKEMLS